MQTNANVSTRDLPRNRRTVKRPFTPEKKLPQLLEDERPAQLLVENKRVHSKPDAVYRGVAIFYVRPRSK